MDFLYRVKQLVYWALGELANSDFEPLRLWLTEPALKVVLSYGATWGFLLILVTSTLVRLREVGRLNSRAETFEAEETASFVWLIERTRGVLLQLGICIGYLITSIIEFVRFLRAPLPRNWLIELERGNFLEKEAQRARAVGRREGFAVGLALRLSIAILICALIELALITTAFTLYTNNDIIQQIDKPSLSALYNKFAVCSQTSSLTDFLSIKLGLWAGLITLFVLGLEKYLDKDFRFDWRIRKLNDYKWLRWKEEASPREILQAETSRVRFYGGHLTLIALDIFVPSIAASVLPLGFVFLFCLPPLIAAIFKNIVTANEGWRIYRIVGYWIIVVCAAIIWVRKAFV